MKKTSKTNDSTRKNQSEKWLYLKDKTTKIMKLLKINDIINPILINKILKSNREKINQLKKDVSKQVT